MLKRFRMHHFRNLADVDVELGSGITLVEGRNGHGKTNFLEAIHWVTQGWSFRTRRFESTLQFGERESWLQIEGEANGNPHWRQDLRYQDGHMQVRTPVAETTGLSVLHGNFHGVYLGPEDIALLREGPELRRRWLDVLLCQRYPDGVELLNHYRRILMQRNRWIKDNKNLQWSALPIGQAEVWESLTAQLCRLGSRIVEYRYQLMQELAKPLQENYLLLSAGQEGIDVSYAPSLGDLQNASAPEVYEQLWDRLVQQRNQELLLGVTAQGPHKDDVRVRFVGNGQLLREVGSQGQCRTAALAMGLAALALEDQNTPPFLLLDDIFAELDTQRREALANVIRERACQVLVASPRLADLPFSVENRLQVQEGKIYSI